MIINQHHDCGIHLMPINGRVRDIDGCIAHIVAALNAGGVPTKASCCGHGKKVGIISLDDGRELFIVPDYDSARQAEKQFSKSRKENNP